MDYPGAEIFFICIMDKKIFLVLSGIFRDIHLAARVIVLFEFNSNCQWEVET
jgi:hypothetical protein